MRLFLLLCNVLLILSGVGISVICLWKCSCTTQNLFKFLVIILGLKYRKKVFAWLAQVLMYSGPILRVSEELHGKFLMLNKGTIKDRTVWKEGDWDAKKFRELGKSKAWFLLCQSSTGLTNVKLIMDSFILVVFIVYECIQSYRVDTLFTVI